MNDNPTVDVKGAEVLQYTERPWTNKKGENSLFKEILVRLSGKVFKFSVSKDCPSFASVVGKSVNLVIALETWGDNLSPSLRVSSFALVK